MKTTWRNWLKASLLTTLFYLLVAFLLVRMALPEPEKKDPYTPVRLSMFEMPQAAPSKQPNPTRQTSPEKVTKNSQKKRPSDEPGYLDPKRQNRKSDANLSVMDPISPP